MACSPLKNSLMLLSLWVLFSVISPFTVNAFLESNGAKFTSANTGVKDILVPGVDGFQNANRHLGYEKNFSNFILNARVASSELQDLIDLRKADALLFPDHIEAYFLGGDVYFNVVWKPYVTSFSWKIIFGYNYTDYVTYRTNYVSAGYGVKQVETYAKENINGDAVLYSAIFYSKSFWESGTTFYSRSKLAYDDTYCCGASSRWTVLMQLGYKPTSISVIRNPSTGNYTVSDSWNDSEDVGSWTGDLEISADKLKSTLTNISEFGLVPIYLRSWEKINEYGQKELKYTYLAYEGDTSGLTFSLGDSRSGFQLILDVAKVLPISFATHEIKAAIDSEEGSGEMYFSVWNLQNAFLDSTR